MTLPEITAKLATHSPRLLSCKEAGMSEGPWEQVGNSVGARIKNVLVGILHRICKCPNPQDARFIAATNGEKPWAELLWKIFTINEAYSSNFEEHKMDTKQPMLINSYQILCDEILLALAAANRLGWVEKGK